MDDDCTDMGAEARRIASEILELSTQQAGRDEESVKEAFATAMTMLDVVVGCVMAGFFNPTVSETMVDDMLAHHAVNTKKAIAMFIEDE